MQLIIILMGKCAVHPMMSSGKAYLERAVSCELCAQQVLVDRDSGEGEPEAYSFVCAGAFAWHIEVQNRLNVLCIPAFMLHLGGVAICP